MGLPVVSERLVLRWPAATDFDALCELWTDELVGQFMGDFGPRDEAGVREWLAGIIADGGRDGSHVQFAVTRRTDGGVVGWLGAGASRGPVAEWNFGYALRAAYRGNGYATEALTATLE